MRELQVPGQDAWAQAGGDGEQIDAYASELLRRGRLAAGWMAGQVDENGALPCKGDLGAYYKCVYPLRMAGYSLQASRMLECIMHLHYRNDGDLRNSDEQKASGNYTSHFSQVYPNGWIIQGAFLLGRFDIVRKLLKGVMDNYYDEEMGTFRSSCRPRVEQFDVNSAATALEVFLLTDIEKAKRAADFLLRLLYNQPDPENWFYSRVRKPFTYITTPDPRSATYSAIRIGEEKQALWFLGLPCAALVQLYDYTGEARYLEAAERFFATFLSVGEPAYCWITSGKSAWAAAMLYRITREKRYLTTLRTLTDFLISLQQEEGFFLVPGMTAEEMGPKLLFDLAPEYVRWFLDIAADLSAAARQACR